MSASRDPKWWTSIRDLVASASARPRVRDAEWWRAQMTRRLADHGITSVAVPLPSCGETGDELGDLYADVDACREAVSAAEGPVVFCGHSYGGMVITEAGADDRVTQLAIRDVGDAERRTVPDRAHRL